MSLQAQALSNALGKNHEALEFLKKMDPKQIGVYVEHDADLRDYVPADLMRNPWTRRIAAMHPDVLLEVLSVHHPKLRDVLDTPQGREWWGRQRRHIVGAAAR